MDFAPPIDPSSNTIAAHGMEDRESNHSMVRSVSFQQPFQFFKYF